eukprot:COSAG05_NODE_1083_length_5933_cov_3.284196_1_plen_397_part_00
MSLNDPWDKMQAADEPNDYVVYGYVDRKVVFESTGAGGLPNAAAKLADDSIHFVAFQFMQNKRPAYALLSWIGPGVPAVKSGKAASAALQLASTLESTFPVHVKLHARSVAELEEDYCIAFLQSATKCDDIILTGGKSDPASKGKGGEGAASVSNTSDLTVHDLQTIFNGMDTYGTGVINLRQFSTWWKKEHAIEAPGALITDDEWEKIRLLWRQFEVEAGGVDADAFHKLTKQLKEEGLLMSVVAADAAEAEELVRQHEEEQARIAAELAAEEEAARKAEEGAQTHPANPPQANPPPSNTQAGALRIMGTLKNSAALFGRVRVCLCVCARVAAGIEEGVPPGKYAGLSLLMIGKIKMVNRRRAEKIRKARLAVPTNTPHAHTHPPTPSLFHSITG